MSKFIPVMALSWDGVTKTYIESKKCCYINIDKIVVMAQDEDYATLFFDTQSPITIGGSDVKELRSVLRGE